MTIESLSDTIIGLKNDLSNLASSPVGIGVASALGGALVGGSIVGAVASRRRKSKKRSRKAPKKKRGKARKSKRKRYTPRTAGKGKDRSTKRIRHTKTGQPYIILKSGKARFISKKSAKASRKRKGGRY